MTTVQDRIRAYPRIKALPLIFDKVRYQSLAILDIHIKAYPQVITFIIA